MRARLAILLGCLLLLVVAPVGLPGLSPPSVQAQETGDEGEPGAEEEAESGTEGADVAEEAGPPWTYQMARMAVGLLLLVAAAIGLMYYRLVIVRSRAEA